MREGARWACKPGSVVGGHLSRTTVSGRLERATRARCGPHHGAPICVCSGWGLPSRRVATTLVVSYTTVSAFPSTGRARQRESSFLRRFPSGYPARPLAGFLPCGARTFLMTRKRVPRSPGPPRVDDSTMRPLPGQMVFPCRCSTMAAFERRPRGALCGGTVWDCSRRSAG